VRSGRQALEDLPVGTRQSDWAAHSLQPLASSLPTGEMAIAFEERGRREHDVGERRQFSASDVLNDLVLDVLERVACQPRVGKVREGIDADEVEDVQLSARGC